MMRAALGIRIQVCFGSDTPPEPARVRGLESQTVSYLYRVDFHYPP